jgi:KDO2-lipid IV(A) lauroyltransferase
VCEPVEIVNTGDREADIVENCARFNRVLEEWVRKYPGHWLWMARRWRRKKSPDEP